MQSGERRLRVLRLVYAVSLGASVVLSLVLAVRNAYWLIAAAGLAYVGIGGWVLAGSRARQGRPANWLASVALLNALIVVPELGLRAAGFQHESRVEFGYPRPSEMLAYRPDPQLFWRLPANTENTNSLGMPGPRDVEVPKPAGVFRLLFIGDSCTWHGYPWFVEEALNKGKTRADLTYETTVLAVPGYTSYQGRVLADLYGAQYGADLAFVYFGWNDHWRAYGGTDAEKAQRPQAVRPGAVYVVYHHSRIWQLVQRAVDSLRPAEAPSGKLRVPIEEYRENLRHIGKVLSEAGSRVVMITAPSAHPARGVEPRLIELGFAPDAETAIRLHREYNEVVREVAYGEGWVLLDLEQMYARRGDLDAVFMDDGIHFQQSWLPEVAIQIRDFLQARRLLPE